MGQKHKRFRESRTPFPLRDIRKNLRSVYARVPQAMAQFVLKIEKLSQIMGPTSILEMARAYGLRPRLWLLFPYCKVSVEKLVKKKLTSKFGTKISDTFWLLRYFDLKFCSVTQQIHRYLSKRAGNLGSEAS